MTPLTDLATHIREVVLKKSFCSFTSRSTRNVTRPVLVSVIAIPSRQVNKCEKREPSFGVIVFAGYLAVSRDQSGIVAPVVNKEDR